MSSLTIQIETASQAWSSLRGAACDERNQHLTMLTLAVGQLGGRKPVTGTRLQGEAVEACAARITAALERLQRIIGDPASAPLVVSPAVDELRIDLADWLESFKETDACP